MLEEVSQNRDDVYTSPVFGFNNISIAITTECVKHHINAR